MGRRSSKVGGARINPSGEFEILLGRSPNQEIMIDCPIKQYAKDYFEFLLSPDFVRQIGVRTVTKRTTRSGLVAVDFTYLEPAYRVSLYLKSPGYAVFVMEEPFVSVNDAPVQDDEYVEMDEDAAEAYA